MDWRGIEWAVPVFEIVMLVLPVYAFVAFFRRVKRSGMGKSKALLRYSALVIAPVAAYAAFFGLLIGIEEVAPVSLVTEGLARSFPILVGLGVGIWLVATLVFSVTLLFLRTRP